LEKPTDRGTKRLESSSPLELGVVVADIAVESVEAADDGNGVETGRVDDRVGADVAADPEHVENVDSAAPRRLRTHPVL